MSEVVRNVLTATVFLVACGTVLALLLALAEKFIMNFGPCAININNEEKKLTVNGGGPLLSLLASQNVFIPSACGGRGTCAYCKVNVTAGGGDIGPIEEPYLSAEERKAGTRLACQVKVRSDIAISVPRELFSVRRFRAKLLEKKSLTFDTLQLRFELLDPGEMEFVAGQYVQLESQPYKGRDAVIRAYSISSAPSDKRHIELIIRALPDGICTTWVFNHLKEGKEAYLSGPYGDFRLRPTGTPIIFAAGGSGMAPIWSILRDMKEKGNTRKAFYFFGAREQRDLYLTSELRQLEKELPDFTFIPTLSREPEGTGWTGDRGRITAIFNRFITDASGYEGYLCGSPELVNACVEMLKKAGLPESNIFFDKFA